MKWLVLGRDGMVSGSLYRYLASQHAEVATTQRRDPSKRDYLAVDLFHVGISDLEALFSGFDVIVNGIVDKRLDLDRLDQYRSSFFVDAYFPHLAARAAARQQARFIHISTDGVFSGHGGPYDESTPCDGDDHYAICKRLGEVNEQGSLNIRCSVVGHETGAPRSLLAWFLSQELDAEVRGYTDQVWNGVTCLQLSKFVQQIADSSLFSALTSETRVIHFAPNAPMSKYELLCSLREVYGGKQRVVPTSSGRALSRVLTTLYGSYYEKTDSFVRTLREQRDFEEGASGREDPSP